MAEAKRAIFTLSCAHAEINNPEVSPFVADKVDRNPFESRMPDLQDPDVFRTVLDSLLTGVFLVGRDRKILFWNDGDSKPYAGTGDYGNWELSSDRATRPGA